VVQERDIHVASMSDEKARGNLDGCLKCWTVKRRERRAPWMSWMREFHAKRVKFTRFFARGLSFDRVFQGFF
jgi:hypothetical protein